MAITLSGQNNVDKITASDGVIDVISGVNHTGVVTATTFKGDFEGNITGNVTGNINNTTLLFQIGGAEKVRIDSDGRLLVGTTTNSISSSQIAEFNGMTYFTNNSSGTGTIYIRNQYSNTGLAQHIIFTDGSGNRAGFGLNNSDQLEIHGHQGILFKAGGTVGGGSEKVRITSTGNVGINSTSPNAQFVINRSLSDNQNQAIEMGYSASSGGLHFIQAYNRSTSAFTLLKINNAVSITSAGKMGLGTNDPVGGDFVVENTTGNAAIALSRVFSGNVASSAVNTPSFAFTMSDTATNDQVVASISPQALAGTGDAFKGQIRVFTANDAGTNTERLRIDSSGNVGINDSTPSYKLDVNGTGRFADDLTINTTKKIQTNSSTGQLTIQPGPSYPGGSIKFAGGQSGATDRGTLIFYAGETTSLQERLRIDSDGRLLVGHTSARVISTTVNPYLQLEGTQYNQSAISVTRNTNDAYGSYLILGKSRATSNGGNAILQDNDIISEVRFAGSDGNDMVNVASQIRVEVDGTPQTDQMPGAMIFYTNPGATSATERLRITSAGVIGVNNTTPDGKGIDVTHGRTTAYAASSDQRSLAHIIARNTSDSSGRFASISLVNGGGTQAEGSINLVQNGNYTGDLAFKLRSASTTWTERLRINVTGEYSGTVDVKGLPAHLRLYSLRNTNDWDNTDPIGKLDFYVGDDTSNNLPYNAGFIHCLNEVDNTGEPSGALLFGTTTANLSGGAVERLRITSDGKVGINKTDPSYQLHVCEDSSVVARFERTGGAWAKVDIKAGNNTGNSYLTFSDTDAVERGEINYEHSDDSLRFGTAGTANRMKIDSDGYVTKPNTPYFHVQGSPSITNTPHDNGLKQYATINSNNGSHYSNSTGVFTVPVAGYYFFSAGVWSANSDANNGTHYALLYKRNSSGGGDVQFAGANHHDAWGQLTMAGGFYCAVGDQIYVYYNGSIQGSTPRNYFSGCLLA